MKKLLLLSLLLIMAAVCSSAQVMMGAYLSDDDPTGLTNIRNRPMGARVVQLPSDEIYSFVLTSPQDGWWKIVELWTIEDDMTDSLTGSDTGEYWIHYSVLGIGTRNYGGECLYLRDAPNEEADVVYSFSEELVLKPMDVDAEGDWVKVKVDGWDIVGWIEAEWLCSNPVTNCC